MTYRHPKYSAVEFERREGAGWLIRSMVLVGLPIGAAMAVGVLLVLIHLLVDHFLM